MRAFTATVLCVGVCLTGRAWADIDSGPDVGKAPPALSVRVVKDGRPAEPADVVKEHAEHTTVYVFLPSTRFDRPAGRYIKTLDQAVQKLQVQSPTTSVVLVWMAEDADAAAMRVAQIQGSLQLLASTWTVWTGPTANGPDGWAIHDRAAVTAVTVGKQKVTARFGYDSVNDTVIPAVEAALKKSLEK
jgi:hypothetical protein